MANKQMSTLAFPNGELYEINDKTARAKLEELEKKLNEGIILGTGSSGFVTNEDIDNMVNE